LIVKRAQSTIGDIASSKGAIGRAWNSADSAEVKEHPDGSASVRLKWNDGEWLSFIADEKAEAFVKLKQWGFA
jgi:hypothetical protein